jgi:hypothetical protein
MALTQMIYVQLDRALNYGGDFWYDVLGEIRRFMENPTINKRRSKVCNTYIYKLVYAPRGLFMKVGNVIM